MIFKGEKISIILLEENVTSVILKIVKLMAIFVYAFKNYFEITCRWF